MEKEVKFNRDTNISDKIVRELENAWNIKFPDNYIKVIKHHDGAKIEAKDYKGEWKEAIIRIPGWREKYAIVEFFGYANASEITSTGVFIAYNGYKECLPEPNKIFPFAVDGAGNLFFFDYRKNENTPEIVFLDHERAVSEDDLTDEDLEEKTLNELLNHNLYYVCDSFDELLRMVEPIE